MGKRLKIALIALVSIGILGFVGVLVAQNVLTSKIEQFLSGGLPEHIEVEYEELDLNVLSGSLNLKKPKVTFFGRTTDSIILVNEMASIVVGDVGYWDYLVNNKISVKNIQINNPKIIYHHNKKIDSKQYASAKVETNYPVVQVGSFEINDGDLSVLGIANDSLLFSVDNFNIQLERINLNAETLKEKIPFSFSDYSLAFEKLFYRMNDYENLEVQEISISPESSNFNNLRLYTAYSKQELSRMISVERDHVDLRIENVTWNNQELGYRQDSIFYFKSPKVVFSNPSFSLYRDKLVNDDTTVKLLYSKMLRNLTFDLTLNEIQLKNATINYSEKVKPDSQAGEILFSQVNTTIKNLGNTFSSSEKTTIDIAAIFMKSTPIKVNWYFDVNNVNDQFIFKAEIGRLPAQDLNPFSEPNLKVAFEGELIKTYFTIDGNVQNSNVDLKTNYDDFKVSVLNKDGKGKKKFLSAVANLFIKKDTGNEADNFREGSKSNLERDKTKSVFNFLWLNARSGLLSAMIGNGKK